MAHWAVVRGTGLATARSGTSAIDELIADALDSALEQADSALEEIDAVVAMGSDPDDGMLSPLIKAEPAGAVGREYLFVVGSFGQAVGAALSILGGGLASAAAVVAWCPASPAVANNMKMIADPFFARPVGATPENLLRLQKAALGLPHDNADVEPTLDIAVCMVLQRQPSGPEGGVRITDCRNLFRPYRLEPDDMDPVAWARQAIEPAEDTGTAGHVVLSGIPGTAPAETASTILDPQPDIAHWLKGAVDLFQTIGRLGQISEPRDVWFVESAGPLGQVVTALRLQGSA